MKVYWDKWEKVYNLGQEVEISDFTNIENLIKQLDQFTYTQVILSGEKNYLLIGGGKGQYVVCFAIGNDDDFYTLINSNKQNSNNELAVVTGGQEGTFPEKIIVDYNSVIEASQYYFENKDKSPPARRSVFRYVELKAKLCFAKRKQIINRM